MTVTAYDATINEKRKELILYYLDGWRLEATNNEQLSDSNINPFVTEEELSNNSANKVITNTEIETAYDLALNKALTFTNRLNIDTLSTVEGDLFCNYVCVWAASDLWNKYNIRVTNEDMEDTYIQSYGGLLYKQTVNGLTPFIIQKTQGFHSIIQRMTGD